MVNTGHKGGIIRGLEELLNRPLQRAICQLHANELPLRHLFQHLDGVTTGPKSFSGPIGLALAKCDSLPAVAYEAIACELDEGIERRNLNGDQGYC